MSPTNLRSMVVLTSVVSVLRTGSTRNRDRSVHLSDFEADIHTTLSPVERMMLSGTLLKPVLGNRSLHTSDLQVRNHVVSAAGANGLRRTTVTVS
jgi:hypothetical protein